MARVIRIMTQCLRCRYTLTVTREFEGTRYPGSVMLIRHIDMLEMGWDLSNGGSLCPACAKATLPDPACPVCKGAGHHVHHCDEDGGGDCEAGRPWQREDTVGCMSCNRTGGVQEQAHGT